MKAALPEATTGHAERRRGESAALLLLLALAQLGPLFRLGFYSDDWWFLSALALAPDRSIGGGLAAIGGPEEWMRPVEWLLRPSLFRLFGWNPVPYHLVNFVLLGASVHLIRTGLVRLGFERTLAFGAAALFATTPGFSSDRFWATANHINFALVLWLASGWAELRAWEARREPGSGRWEGIALVSGAASVLAYELFLPLLALNALLLFRARWQETGGSGARRLLGACPWSRFASVAALGLFKLSMTTRIGADDDLLVVAREAFESPAPDLNGFRIVAALQNAFGTWGFGLPVSAARLLRGEGSLVALFAALAAGAVAFRVLARRSSAEEGRGALRGELAWRRLAVSGVAVFFLGWALFFTTRSVQLTPTGLGNRTAIASALGASMLVAALLRGGAQAAPAPSRPLVFALLVSILVACGVAALERIGRHFATASERQRVILEALRSVWATPGTGSRLMLDGICPYVGPAPVFDASWDLAGAVRWTYRDRSLDAGIVSARLAVTERGLVSFEGAPSILYAYPLLVFDARTSRLVTLGDLMAAREYFRSFEPRLGGECPPSRAGWGVPLF